jgi:hypothetical protein
MALQTLLLILLATAQFVPSFSLISTPDLNPRYPSPRAISVSILFLKKKNYSLLEWDFDSGFFD